MARRELSMHGSPMRRRLE